MPLLGDVTAIVFAKQPRAGLVKTRLARAPGIGPEAAAAVAEAMLRCTVERLTRRGEVVLAASPDGCGPALLAGLGLPALPTVDQGPGDLGSRLARVWLAVRPEGPVAFFGADSPDLPDAHLAAIAPGLAEADLALGPTPDGGYWTLAAGCCRPAVLQGIDWGTDCVYDQTVQRATSAGLSLRVLDAWPDVDDPDDVEALRGRLASRTAGPADRPLRRLARRLEAVVAGAGASKDRQ